MFKIVSQNEKPTAKNFKKMSLILGWAGQGRARLGRRGLTAPGLRSRSTSVSALWSMALRESLRVQTAYPDINIPSCVFLISNCAWRYLDVRLHLAAHPPSTLPPLVENRRQAAMILLRCDACPPHSSWPRSRRVMDSIVDRIASHGFTMFPLLSSLSRKFRRGEGESIGSLPGCNAPPRAGFNYWMNTPSCTPLFNILHPTPHTPHPTPHTPHPTPHTPHPTPHTPHPTPHTTHHTPHTHPTTNTPLLHRTEMKDLASSFVFLSMYLCLYPCLCLSVCACVSVRLCVCACL
jgi:hypothetical protein